MSFSGALEWWQEWQLRVLVLSSLGVQCYLALFARARKKHNRPLFRFSIWLAYLGGDALAIYALAILFNRQRKLQYSSVDSSHGLEVLWAPILLWHLGGQINISAYNIEDNELWTRHVLTAVAQVAVALYVFCKSWSSSADVRLLAAAILLFIIGVFKCFDKPSALRRASFNSIVTTFRAAPSTNTTNTEVRLEEYIQHARGFLQRNKNISRFMSSEQVIRLLQLSIPDKLFVDYAYDYHERLMKLEQFWLLKDKEVTYRTLFLGLSKTFDLIYSKIGQGDDENRATPIFSNVCSKLLSLSNLLLPIVPICLFHSSHKGGYRASDTKVTFLLLYITYFMGVSSYLTMLLYRYQWSDKVAQHSLMEILARNKRHTKLMSIAEFLQCKGLLDTHFGLEPCHSSRDITRLVREHIKTGWISHITDIESYWRFSDSRGQWALERNGSEEILWSVEKPFDESIILWHVATDFCFYSKGTSPHSRFPKVSKQISNYLMHLLFAKPEMLLPGSRRNLFTVCYGELEAIIQDDDDLSLLSERGLTLMIMNKVGLPKGFIRDSWILAQELMRLGDDNKMWEVIKDVWIEMLCFSAGRCRGYLHAKSLGSGGEFLSFVSLLMSHAGLETYAERQQRVHLRLPKGDRTECRLQSKEYMKQQATKLLL